MNNTKTTQSVYEGGYEIDTVTISKAELDALKDDIAEYIKITSELSSENVELRLDAERYRWLKENYHGFEMFKKSSIPYVTLDSEVDKARTQS